MNTLDYHWPTEPMMPPGRTAARVSIGCVLACAALSAIGIPGQYHTNFMSRQQVAFALVLILAWLIGLAGSLFGIAGTLQSRGRRGLVPAMCAVAVVCLSVWLTKRVFPPYGLGNIH